MGKLSLKDKVCILVSCALMWTCCAADQVYSPLLRNLTWDQARSYCQVCFKDLVTLTPENIQTITQNLTSDYWIGLRKNFSSTSNSTSMAWSSWANGDPLVFQNWYPGWPVFKSTFPKRDCCSCSCTCPATTTQSMTSYTGLMTQNVTSFSGFDATKNSTDTSSFTDQSKTPVFTTAAPMTASPPIEATCERSPMLLPDVPDPDENYVEDSCVAMLSFGAWVEKNCSELLPFICYDDHFLGQASVASVTTQSAVLTWLPGPGNISHYRIVVNNNTELAENVTGLTLNLVSLTAGTLYSVQVFPVKCERDLNPQAVAFSTTPNKVKTLTVTNVTETSVFLSWDKPDGNVDFYLIKVQSEQIRINAQNNTVGTQVNNLMPGSFYRFTVISGVESRWSNESTVEAYTKPGKVFNLMVSNITNNSLVLSWEPPIGSYTGFTVIATNDGNDILFHQTMNNTEVKVAPLPTGTKITLSVTALAKNNTVEGDNVTVVNYTAPGPISNLKLVSNHDSINAIWNPPESNYSSFIVQLQLDGKIVNTKSNLTDSMAYFLGLMTGASYTVIVYSVSGQLKGPPVESSKFTLPLPPTDVNVSFSNKSQITLQWNAPVNAATVNYSVKISSIFWQHSWTDIVQTTNHTFYQLNSGTRYDFEVQTLANGSSSTPVNASRFTDVEKREISLSMMCSSAEPLLCDKKYTMESVFTQLNASFKEVLGDGIFWKLKKP